MKETTKTNKKNYSKAITVGICIVIIAALIVAAAIFYPSIRARHALRDITDHIKGSGIKSATVHAPSNGNNVFDESGNEHIATEDELARLKDLILKITDGAEYSSSDSEEILFDYEYRIRFRIESGEALGFFFTDGKFYIANDGVRYFFISGDESAYLELISLAKSLTEPENH